MRRIIGLAIGIGCIALTLTGCVGFVDPYGGGAAVIGPPGVVVAPPPVVIGPRYHYWGGGWQHQGWHRGGRGGWHR